MKRYDCMLDPLDDDDPIMFREADDGAWVRHSDVADYDALRADRERLSYRLDLVDTFAAGLASARPGDTWSAAEVAKFLRELLAKKVPR